MIVYVMLCRNILHKANVLSLALNIKDNNLPT